MCERGLTRSQVIAFIVAVVACFVFLVAGLPPVMDAFRGVGARERLRRRWGGSAS